MKLRRLTLHGFKSFADRTELRFHDGMTAIVGPNGCGKSNISDAVRWVLGEQRASAIRGSKMEEAIFQGTSGRRALNRAEVSLVFSNEDRRLPLPYDEIEIRRTVYREGGSEYELNRTACRLKDIHDLFRDTGLGANAYTVIEQRMVDAILSDRADERRAMFEEAAGIGRYKDRRQSAQRRLESAEADLSRLEDLIAEVESKVRSLGRQRRRAERYRELRARRLALEMSLATLERESIAAALSRVAARLEELGREEPALRANLSAAEAELERRRIESAELARMRNAAAAKLSEIGRRIADRERELAVADERRAHAERRLAQIAVERAELVARVENLERESAALEAERARHAEEVAALREQLEEATARQQELRAQLQEARRLDEEARRKEEELARELARLEAEAAGAEARAAEAQARLERLQQERLEVTAELERLDEQGDLFVERTRELREARAAIEAEREAAAAELEALRARELEARRRLSEAEDRAGLVTAHLAALEALDREYHGFSPSVAAVLGARDLFEGVIGPLSDFLRLPKERAAMVEATLASVLQAVVIRDPSVIDRIREWLAGQDPEHGGAVALLPEDALPRVEALLEEIRFVGVPPSEPVLLGRRERLEELRVRAAEAVRERDECAAERVRLAEAIAAAEVGLREIEARAQATDLELRRADADEAARSGQRSRGVRMLEALERQQASLSAMAAEARAAHEEAVRQREVREAELEACREARRQSTAAVAERQQAWEEVREEEASLRVACAHAEAALQTVERRITAAQEALKQASVRISVIDQEESEHRATLGQLEGLRTGTGGELEELFLERDAVTGELRELDERLTAATEAAEALEASVRELRRSLESLAEERHTLELRRAEQESAERSIRERVEVEWGRPFEVLAREAERVEGEPEALRAELNTIAADIERLGPINMLAFEEYEEESKRLEFLKEQRDDLVRARDDLVSAIRQINRTARQLFLETFETVRQNFRDTFQSLFEGGECDIWLSDPEDPLESAIEIMASPRGKRTQRIHLLSGGERALTALSLLFAFYLVKPSPFCVLDEVDAPLDEANIGRFLNMLRQFKSQTQFIVITHNPRTMGAADWIYGVTMEEPGVSSIVGVKMDEALVGAATAG
ncbi:MAG TPA: AAA family ATPase [Longimicrobiales bacterium]|nr:AAA family ATPase [Longimicrobiales bacterium]